MKEWAVGIIFCAVGLLIGYFIFTEPKAVMLGIGVFSGTFIVCAFLIEAVIRVPFDIGSAIIRMWKDR